MKIFFKYGVFFIVSIRCFFFIVRSISISIIIKGADKGSVVVVWDREDYLKEAYRQLDDKEVYEQFSDHSSVLANTLMKALEKNTSAGGFAKGHSWLFSS